MTRQDQRLAPAVKSLFSKPSIVRLHLFEVTKEWTTGYFVSPVGRHAIEGLGLAIDFGPCGNRRN